MSKFEQLAEEGDPNFIGLVEELRKRDDMHALRL